MLPFKKQNHVSFWPPAFLPVTIITMTLSFEKDHGYSLAWTEIWKNKMKAAQPICAYTYTLIPVWFNLCQEDGLLK